MTDPTSSRRGPSRSVHQNQTAALNAKANPPTTYAVQPRRNVCPGLVSRTIQRRSTAATNTPAAAKGPKSRSKPSKPSASVDHGENSDGTTKTIEPATTPSTAAVRK